MTDAKPTLHQYFYETYFIPEQRRTPNEPLPAILDRAKEKAPFEVPISIRTLHDIRKRR